MAAEVVISECPKCGAGLDVFPDSVTLRCHQCSLAVQVSRREGSVVLTRVGVAVLASESFREPPRWADQFSMQSGTAEIEAAIEELGRKEAAILQRLARTRFRSRVADLLRVILAGGIAVWFVHDRDRGTQITMGIIFLGIIICGLPFRRTFALTFQAAKLREVSSDPPELGAVRKDIQRLGDLLSEKGGEDPHSAVGSRRSP